MSILDQPTRPGYDGEEPESERTPSRAGAVSRRAFLGGGGALVVSIGLPRLLGGPVNAQAAAAPAAAARRRMAPLEGPDIAKVDSWLAVHDTGRVTIYTGRAELGTGTATMTLQIAADELDVSLDRLDLVEPDTTLTVDQTYTAGSQTTRTQWGAGLRQACAQARTQLMSMASQRLGVPASQLTVNDGVISGGGRNVSYAELIGDRRFDARISPRVVTRPVADYRVIGKSIPRIDIPGKVMGTFPYVHDVVLPGMLHARMVRPPTPDSRLVDVNDANVVRMPGIVRVAVKGNRIGVIAHTEQQAIDGAAALRPRWKIGPLPDQATIYDYLRNQTPHSRRVLVGTLVDSRGAPEAIRDAATQHSATYYFPFQLHGTLGASCAVADVSGGGATVYTGTQGVYPLRDAIGTALGIDGRRVHAIYVEASGCYGLNAADSVAIDAALMSQAAGAPVRVQYMRADEHTTENFGQAMVMEAEAGLDRNNMIVGWNYNAYQASRGSRPGPPGNVVAGGIAGFPVAPAMPAPPPEPPLGPDSSNAVSQYQVPHMRVVSWSVPSPFFTGPLRSPNRIQNTFANESFVDELAFIAREDPIAFRLKHLRDPRLIAVFNRAREAAKWTPRVAHSRPGSGRVLTGRGIAGMEYEGTESYAAVITEVQVDTSTGQVRVPRVWAAQDCGLMINFDGMRAQAEGCCLQGISRALQEEVKWTPSSMESIDWVTYPILTFTQMPELFDFHVINRKDQPALGAGEVVITAMIGSIANAIFDATGARLRQVPFTPERIRAALRSV